MTNCAQPARTPDEQQLVDVASILAGGGIRGGQVIGRTDRDGAEVVDRPISVPDFPGTFCKVLDITMPARTACQALNAPFPS